MQATKHPFHSIDFEYLRASKSRICKSKRPVLEEFTHFKGQPVYRNLYYGTEIPKDQEEKVNQYNIFLKEELTKGTIKPHLPEFWSFHDSWRFADAAGYEKENMVRDAIDHSPWIEEMKNFN